MKTAPPRPQAATLSLPETPYVGLVPYREEDAAFFFGRDAEEHIVTGNLRASRLTILYGASGVGKTSLLEAGVIHALHEHVVANAAAGRARATFAVCSFRAWRDDPLPALLETIRSAGIEALGDGELPGRRPGEPIVDTLRSWTERVRTLLVVLDQFEDYFLYHPDEEGEGTFAAEFPRIVNEPNLRVHFLLSIREDAWSKLDRFKGRIPRLFANYLRAKHLGRDAAREAIEGPVLEWNRRLPAGEQPYTVESALVPAVIEATTAGRLEIGANGDGARHETTGADAVEAPFLQLVMERLWRATVAAGSHELTVRRLQELGGAQQIVANHLHDALRALTRREKAVAADVCRYLVTRTKTKIAHSASDLAEWTKRPEPEVSAVLEKLCRGESGRILRAVHPFGEEESTRYELFHDVLAEPILEWRRGYEQWRTRRRYAVIGAGLLALVAVFAALGSWALVQRSHARAEARRAQARELAARSATELSVDPVRSVGLAAGAARLEPSPQTEDVLRTALRGLKLDAIFQMHAPVATVQFSPDGRELLVAGGDHARLFDVRSRRLVRTLNPGGPTTGAWFDPNGRLLLTAGDDGTARAWNPGTGRLLYRLRHGARINSATFSKDGRLLATASDDRTARIWRASDGRLLRTLRHPRAVETTSFSGDGTLLATAAGDTISRIFDVATGRLVSRLTQPGAVTDVTFAPRGVLVATGGADKVARIWDARTGRLRLALRGHVGRVLDVDFDPLGDRLVTASADQTARVWDARTGALLTTLFGETNQVLHARFSPDGKSIVTASSDRAARVFDATGTLRSTLAGHGDTVEDAMFSPDGESVATASTDGTARLWSWRSQPYLQLVGRHRGPVVAAQFSPDGHRLLSAGADGHVRIWKLRGGPVASIGGPAPITSASFAAGKVVTSSTDGVARLWRLPGHLLREFREPGGITVAALAPDGRTVATANAKGQIPLWDAATGRVIHSLSSGRVTALRFSSDGRELVAGGADSVARLWRVDSGSVLHELRGHRGPIVAVSFSPDDRHVVTAGVDHTARLWNVATGKVEHVLRGHRKPLTAAAFSPDGRLVVTTSRDRDARLWDVATGRGLAVLRVHYGVASDAAFTSDSRWVVTTGGGGAALFSATDGRILYLLRSRDSLPLQAATSPNGWRIVIAGSDGYVETYDCRLCGGLEQLRSLTGERLAQLHATP